MHFTFMHVLLEKYFLKFSPFAISFIIIRPSHDVRFFTKIFAFYIKSKNVWNALIIYLFSNMLSHILLLWSL